MKHENPIEEIWRIRDKLGAEEGYDVHRLFERLRQEEKKYGDRLVRVVPRRAPEESAAVLHEDPPKGD
jgi:Ser/Thr protein kinase RdoA (MazF antagonist)